MSSIRDKLRVRSQSGMTMIELSVSVAVLSIMTLALYPLFDAAKLSYSTNSAAFTVIKEAQKGVDWMKSDLAQTDGRMIAIENTNAPNMALAFPLMHIGATTQSNPDADGDGQTSSQEVALSAISYDYDRGYEVGFQDFDGNGSIEVVNGDGEFEVFPVWKAICIYCPVWLQEDHWQLRRYVVTSSEAGVPLNTDSLPVADVAINVDGQGHPSSVSVTLNDGTILQVMVGAGNGNNTLNANPLMVGDEVLANYLATRDEDDPAYVVGNQGRVSSLELQFALEEDGGQVDIRLPIERAPDRRLRQGIGAAASLERNTIEASLFTSVSPRVQ